MYQQVPTRMCLEASNQCWDGDCVTYSAVPWNLSPQIFVLWGSTQPCQVIYACTWLWDLALGLGFHSDGDCMWHDTADRHRLSLNGCLHGHQAAPLSCRWSSNSGRALSASAVSSTQVKSHLIKAELRKSCMKWKGFGHFSFGYFQD